MEKQADSSVKMSLPDGWQLVPDSFVSKALDLHLQSAKWDDEVKDDVASASPPYHDLAAKLVGLPLKTKVSMLSDILGKPRRKDHASKTHEHVFTLPMMYGPISLPAATAGVGTWFDNNDPVNNYSWASMAAIFSEYRVVRMRETVNLSVSRNTDSLFPQYVATCIDDEAATAATLPTLGLVYGHVDTLILHNATHGVIETSWDCLEGASDPDDTWKLTSAPAATGAIKGVVSVTGGGTLSLGSLSTHFTVQFRGLEM